MEFDLQGHRGARGLAPENTLRAFELAIAIGVTTLELDTAVTRDGVVVVAHDRRLNPDITRGPDGRWIRPPTPLVRELTFSELQRFDVGRINPASAYSRRFPNQKGEDGLRMPRLEEVFELGKTAAVRFNVETKLSPLAPREAPAPLEFCEALLSVIRAARFEDRVTVQSFDWRTLQLVQTLEPRLHVSYLTAADYVREDSPWTGSFRPSQHGSVPRMVRAAGGMSQDCTWSPDFTGLTREAAHEALGLGLKVLPWTINEPGDMARMVDWGVSGLITDYPDLGKHVLRERGLDVG